jgi:hypothetical protein
MRARLRRWAWAALMGGTLAMVRTTSARRQRKPMAAWRSHSCHLERHMHFHLLATALARHCRQVRARHRPSRKRVNLAHSLLPSHWGQKRENVQGGPSPWPAGAGGGGAMAPTLGSSFVKALGFRQPGTPLSEHAVRGKSSACRSHSLVEFRVKACRKATSPLATAWACRALRLGRPVIAAEKFVKPMGPSRTS